MNLHTIVSEANNPRTQLRYNQPRLEKTIKRSHFPHNSPTKYCSAPINKRPIRMSISEKQLEANRQNAQKSTGPKTEEGKKTSSRNATKHGLHATDIIINSPNLKEDQSQYDLLVESLFTELKPRGVFQEHLVLKIANCMWRYRRGINAESATIAKQVNPPEVPGLELKSEVGQYMQALERAKHDDNWFNSRTIPVGESALNLLRYEWRLDRELYRTYRLLNFLQLKEASDSAQKLISEK